VRVSMTVILILVFCSVLCKFGLYVLYPSTQVPWGSCHCKNSIGLNYYFCESS
jgi:hypothetical protein